MDGKHTLTLPSKRSKLKLVAGVVIGYCIELQSIKEIAKTYKEKGASIAAFINEEGEPIVDPTQYETMKTNFAITKAMTAEERKALEVYMMSFE